MIIRKVKPTQYKNVFALSVAYRKLNSIARNTDRSLMTPAEHREFMAIICRAQSIIRLELEQAGEVEL